MEVPYQLEETEDGWNLVGVSVGGDTSAKWKLRMQDASGSVCGSGSLIKLTPGQPSQLSLNKQTVFDARLTHGQGPSHISLTATNGGALPPISVTDQGKVQPVKIINLECLWRLHWRLHSHIA